MRASKENDFRVLYIQNNLRRAIDVCGCTKKINIYVF